MIDDYVGVLENGVGFNKVFEFDGIDDYISFSDDSRLDGFLDYTLSVWVYMNSFSTYNAIFHKWDYSGYAYFLGIWNGLGYNNQVVVGENFGIDTGGNVGNYDVSNSSLYSNIWYNITFTQ